jgi:hypothetical protein
MIPNEMVQSHTKRHQGNIKDTKKTGKIWHRIEKERLWEYKRKLRYFVHQLL